MALINLGSDEQFDQLVSKGVVLVDFYADWCGPCKMIAPVLDEITKENPNYSIVKVNVDSCQETAKKYDVKSIPTLLLFKDGKVIETKVGFAPKPVLVELFTKNM